MRLVTIFAIAVPVLVLGGLGAGFLSLGANAVPPEQTTVHKEFPAGRFTTTQASPPVPSLASVMPPPAAAPTAAAVPPTAAAVPSKGTATSPAH